MNELIDSLTIPEGFVFLDFRKPLIGERVVIGDQVIETTRFSPFAIWRQIIVVPE